MLDVRYSTKFKKDYKDHNLIGDYSGYRECHLAPDCLLIHKQTDNELRLNRTGSHADLFGM